MSPFSLSLFHKGSKSCSLQQFRLKKKSLDDGILIYMEYVFAIFLYNLQNWTIWQQNYPYEYV